MCASGASDRLGAGEGGAAEQRDAADEARLDPYGAMVMKAHHPLVVRASQLIASVRQT
jgi:hypothetical protein